MPDPSRHDAPEIEIQSPCRSRVNTRKDVLIPRIIPVTARESLPDNLAVLEKRDAGDTRKFNDARLAPL
jgi:hypothetical protein